MYAISFNGDVVFNAKNLLEVQEVINIIMKAEDEFSSISIEPATPGNYRGCNSYTVRILDTDWFRQLYNFDYVDLGN